MSLFLDIILLIAGTFFGFIVAALSFSIKKSTSDYHSDY